MPDNGPNMHDPPMSYYWKADALCTEIMKYLHDNNIELPTSKELHEIYNAIVKNVKKNMKVVNSMLDITSLSDDARHVIMGKCDTCANDGKGADKCRINADGKCNYEPVSEPPHCELCAFGVEEIGYDDHGKKVKGYICSIGQFFANCTRFVDKRPKVPFMPIDDKTICAEMVNVKMDEPVPTHRIKILESFANAVLAGDKTFEVRKNDRGYQKGDLVKFTVIDSDGIEKVSHPLIEQTYTITYVLAGWGIEDGYVVFGIRKVS